MKTNLNARVSINNLISPSQLEWAYYEFPMEAIFPAYPAWHTSRRPSHALVSLAAVCNLRRKHDTPNKTFDVISS